MTPDRMAKIDELMKEKYGAARSLVTDKEWKKVSENVWVCGYIKYGLEHTSAPEMYLVHHAVFGSNLASTIIYSKVEVIQIRPEKW